MRAFGYAPIPGLAINLEQPAAFNAHVEASLVLRRGSWRRVYPGTRSTSDLDVRRPARLVGSPDHIDEARADAGVHRSSHQ